MKITSFFYLQHHYLILTLLVQGILGDINMYKKTAIILCLFSMIFAQDNVELEENRHFNSYQINLDRFKQLNEDITTPNTYRTAAGYPGHEYWQVRADYDMKLRIDDNKQRLYGEETVTFYNNSPDALNYCKT